MKYIKTKILIPLSVYEDLKSYLKRTSYSFKTFTVSTFVEGYEIIFSIIEDKIAEIFKDNYVKCIITIYKEERIISKNEFSVQRTSELLLILEFTTDDNYSFLVNIDKEGQDTVASATSKLIVLKRNIHDIEYIRNYILYANFKNERELIDVCYLLIANKEILKNDDNLRGIVE